MRTKTPPTPQRLLMIKTKACQRLLKEVSYYEREVLENEAKLKQMKDQQKNPYDIKKFGEVLAESHMMVPDSKNRFDQALSDLAAYMDSSDVVDLATEITSDEWYLKARELLNSQNISTEKTSGDFVEETDLSGLQEGEAF